MSVLYPHFHFASFLSLISSTSFTSRQFFLFPDGSLPALCSTVNVTNGIRNSNFMSKTGMAQQTGMLWRGTSSSRKPLGMIIMRREVRRHKKRFWWEPWYACRKVADSPWTLNFSLITSGLRCTPPMRFSSCHVSAI